MTDTTDGGPPTAAASLEYQPHRLSGAIVWTLRVLAVLLLLDLVFQVVLAGMFITGDIDLLAMHSANASIPLVLLALLSVIAAVLLRWPARGPVAPMWWSVALLVLMQAQSGFGFARLVAIHIPLGVALFGLSAVFAFWAVRYRHAPAALEAERAARKARRKSTGGAPASTDAPRGDAR